MFRTYLISSDLGEYLELLLRPIDKYISCRKRFKIDSRLFVNALCVQIDTYLSPISPTFPDFSCKREKGYFCKSRYRLVTLLQKYPRSALLSSFVDLRRAIGI